MEKLAAIGVEGKEMNVRNKLSRRKLKAAFIAACF
ncbi:DUF6471 domain-containing protein [Fulvimarina manganoxydans]